MGSFAFFAEAGITVSRACGECIHYTKINGGKSLRAGICEKFDWRTHADDRKPCSGFEALRYSRKKDDKRIPIQEE